MKLTKGQKYNVSKLTCAGWTSGDGTGNKGYNFADYFRDGVYLGPDEHGIEPVFQKPKPTRNRYTLVSGELCGGDRWCQAYYGHPDEGENPRDLQPVE